MPRSTTPCPVGRTPALIIGAVIGTLALAACGSAPQPGVNLTDPWLGTWVSDNDATGSLDVMFTQTGTQLRGTVEVGGTACFTTGTITGTVSGNTITFGVASGASDIEYSGGVAHDAVTGDDTITGSYSVTSGACDGDTGTFELLRMVD